MGNRFRAISLAIVIATLISASTFAQQNNQCCECKSGSGPFKAPIPSGYGSSVCSGTCAASGGQATGRVSACVTAPSNSAPNRIPFDNAYCFSKEGAAGNCKGNNWCTCGTSQVYVFDEAEHVVEPRIAAPRVGYVWVLVNQKVKFRADLSGFGGSVSQNRKELGPPKTIIRIADQNKQKGPWEEFPLPGISNFPSSPKLQFITHSWSTPGKYDVYVYATGYYHWSGDDGSCSYSCVTQAACPGNNYLVINVVDKPAFPGKKYPSGDPE